MKTTIYIVFVVFFGAFFLTPTKPKIYPPKKVLQQKESIVFKEIKIDQTIHKIEHEIKIANIELKTIKEK